MKYNIKITPHDEEYDYEEYKYITIHIRNKKCFAYSFMRYDGCPMYYITIFGITIAWGNYYEYLEKNNEINI